jgi:ABC-2 type transport system ATP-binding protein
LIVVENLTKEFKIPVQKSGKLAMVRNLFSSEFKIKRAVDDISFHIQKGEIVGYIGKNGAGKSTTIKMLSGILQPTSGRITVNGVEPSRDRMINAEQIGVVFGQKSQLWWDVPLIESYKLLKAIYKIDDKTYNKNLDYFVPMLALEEVIEKPVRQMSLGQRVKSDIVAALLHNPPILFLDEPTIGVDVVSKKYLYDFILKVNQEKQTTIILTTHDMNDMIKLCSRIMIINEGKLMYDGSLPDMTEKYGKMRSLLVELESEIPDFPVPGAKCVKSEASKKTYVFNRFETTPSKLIEYISKQYSIVDLQVIEPEIEEIVRNMYE